MPLQPRPALVLAGAGLFLAVITCFWVWRDTGIAPPTDSAHHLITSIIFSRSIDAGGLAGLWDTMRHFYVGWPPASYVLLYGPLGWLLGDQSQLMRLFGLALLPIFLWGTYRLCRSLGQGRKWSVLGAVLCIFSFGVAGQVRQVSIDLPTAAAVLLTMLALVRSAGPASPRRALLLGAACGLCLFSRVQSVFFLAGPILIFAATTLFEARSWRRRGERVLALCLSGAVAALVSSPWWSGRLRSLWKVSTDHLDPGQVTPRGDPEFWAGIWYYLGALGKLCGWPLLLLVLGTLPLLILRPGSRRSITVRLVLPWIVGGIIGCAMGVHREPRYLLPVIPAMAALAVEGLSLLAGKRRELAGAALLLTVALPTILVMGFPVRHGHPLVKRGLVEWAYTRETVRVHSELAGRHAAAAILQSNNGDTSGANTYLLVQQDPKDQFMARLAVFLSPYLPKLMFSPLVNQQLINSPLHLRERRRRQVFVLAEGSFLLNLPFIWEIKRLAFGNERPVRLYRVRPNSKLRGPIWRTALRKRAKEPQPDPR